MMLDAQGGDEMIHPVGFASTRIVDHNKIKSKLRSNVHSLLR